jgi:hypothetical protein
MSFQNTFRNVNSSSSSPREYFINYNNYGTGLSTISNTFYYIFGSSGSSAQSSSSSKSSNSSFYLDLGSLGVSCVCDESNCGLRN